MKLSLFLLSLLFSTIAVAKTGTDGDDDAVAEDVEEYSTDEDGGDTSLESNAAALQEDDELTESAAPEAVAGAEDPAPAAKPFRYTPSRRLEESENAMPEDRKRPIASGKVKEEIDRVAAAAMSTPAAAQGLADVDHEWRLLLAGPEAARVIGTGGGNAKRLLTSRAGSEFISTALATAHVLLSKAGEETRGSGLGRVLSTAFHLFALPTMPDLVNKAGGLLLTAVSKDDAALFVRRFWDEVRLSLSDRLLANKLNKCNGNVLSLMKTFHDSDNAPKTSAAKTVRRSSTRK